LATSEICADLRPIETIDELVRAGRERLYPSISNPNWIVLRSRRRIFRRWFHSLSLQDAKALDIGGRIQPYRELIPFPHTYWSLDVRQTALVNVLANAESLPFADDSLDLVLCTQMVEYVTEPAALAREIYRVLRPGGSLFLSAPSIFPRDSEHDRWRFFPVTLKQLLTQFSEVEVLPECGSIAGFLRTIAVMCDFSARYKAVRFALGCSLFPLINILAAFSESLIGIKDGPFTVNYSVRAVK
jgi:SAM-dependent methyltransferase